MKLYEMTDAWNAIIASLEESEDGTVSEKLAEHLTELEMNIGQKFDGCGRLIRGYLADETAYKTEAERLTKLARTSAAHAKWLKGYVKEQMEQLGETKLQTELFKFAIQRNGQSSVRVLDLGIVPHEFDVEQERKVNLKDIAKAVEDGEEVLGVEVTRGTHLRVR